MSQIELQVTGFLVTVVREYHFQLLMALQTSGREGGSTAASPHAKARSKKPVCPDGNRIPLLSEVSMQCVLSPLLHVICRMLWSDQLEHIGRGKQMKASCPSQERKNECGLLSCFQKVRKCGD